MAADINFYGLLYEFHRTSTNGADILITIEKKWYEGEVKQRALGRAPVIKRENKDHIFGTSCELYAECLVDGEYADMYTSDPNEFRVSVYKDETLLWQGYVSPELYSEPDVAPPYDVQITATDGLGELKNSIYEERGAASILSHIMGLIGQYPIYVISGLRYVDSTGAISQDHDILNVRINLDHEKGNSKYDVLQNLLTSLNANITQLNGRYVIFRETDFINKVTDEGVEAFDVNGEKVYIPVASFGSMTSHQWWPIGQLSTVIEPAKNSLVLQAPNHYKDNVLDFSQWSALNSAEYDATEDAYILPDEGSYITQALDFDNEVGYRLGLRIRARNVGAGPYGGTSDEDQNIGIKVEITGRAYKDYLGNMFWLIKSEGISSGHPLSDYMWKATEDFLEEELRVPSDSDTASDAQNIDIVLPLYDTGRGDYGSYVYAETIKITIFNPAGIHDIYVYDVSLVKYEQSEGYEAKVVINNAAREAESDIDLSMSSASFAPAAGNMFMTGLPMQADGLLIEQWQIPGSAAQEYLSAMSYDYARAVALPKMKYSGVLNVPDTATILPILFLRDGTYYFPKTYTYDLYNDEIQVELISISAADVSLSSVVISQYAESSGNMGGVTTGGAGGGSVVSLPRDKVMSDTSDNAVENRVIKAYVDSEVKDLADLLTSMWRIEDDKIVTDMDVLVKANLIVEKDTSSGGSGSDTPASGTVTGIKVSATQTLEPNNAGIIDMVSTLASIDVSDQLEDYAKLTDIPSLDGYAKTTDVNNALSLKQNTIDANNKLPYSLISDTPTFHTLTLKKADGSNLVVFDAEEENKSVTLDKGVVGLGNVDNLAASGYLTALSSNTTNAVSITIGGTTKNITADTMKTSLGLGSLAYLNSLSKSDVGLGNVENTALSTWAGTNNITTLGTITSGTWQGSRVSKSYLDADLVAWFDAVSPLLVKDSSGNIKISTNLIVTGDTSSGGSGSDTPASGTVTGVTVGSTDYTDVNAGLLNLTSLMNLYTPLTSHNALATRVGALESGSATAISVTGSGNVISGVSKSGTTITFTKGVTALTNITKSMVDSVLGGTTSSNANKFLMCTGSTSVWAAISKTNVTDALGYTPANNASLANYLPLSGGTIGSGLSNSFPLLISSTNAYTGLAFYTSGGTGYMRFQGGSTWGVTDAGWNNSYTLIHSGNIGSQFVEGIGTAYANQSINFGREGKVRMIYSSASNSTDLGYPLQYMSGLSVVTGYTGWQMVTYGGTIEPNPYFRKCNDSGTWLAWKKLAFLDDNVASATKLATARTIWGQSFDGTGNVSGNMSNVGNVRPLSDSTYLLGTSTAMWKYAYINEGILSNSTNGYFIGSRIGIGATDGGLLLYSYGATPMSFYTNSSERMHITAGGNVGIGTTSPQYKLDVAGTGRFTGAVTLSSSLSVGGNISAGPNLFMNSTGEGIYLTSDSVYWHKAGSYSSALLAFAASEIIAIKPLRPANNNSYTLGTSSYQWSTIYGVNGIFSGDTSSGSDIRFKDIIKNKTLKIEHIAKAPLFTFRWNDREDDSIHLGSSAQYWEKVCPWLVTGEDFKSLNYATLGVAMGISLAKKAVNHEERIKELEKEIKRLKEEMRYGS